MKEMASSSKPTTPKARYSARLTCRIRNGRVCRMHPTKVAKPVIAHRKSGLPRPVSDPSSESPSEKPMLIPAPTAAAKPTRNVTPGSLVAKAVANSGASVETDPSIKPTRHGWTTRNTKFLLCPEAVISRPPSPKRSSQAAKYSPPEYTTHNPPQYSNHAQA